MVLKLDEVEPKPDGTIEVIPSYVLGGDVEVSMGDGETEMVYVDTQDIEVYWFNERPIRYYPIPTREDLGGEGEFLKYLLEKLEDYETRFMRHSDAGSEVKFSEKDIQIYQQNLAAAQRAGDPEREEVAKGMLAISEYRHALEAAKEHINFRIEGGPSIPDIQQRLDETEMLAVVKKSLPEAIAKEGGDALVEAVLSAVVQKSGRKASVVTALETHAPSSFHGEQIDTTFHKDVDPNRAAFAVARSVRDEAINGMKGAVLGKLKAVAEENLLAISQSVHDIRLKGGVVDKDDVLNEMKGEPYNIFMGTLPGGEGYLRNVFHENRFRKAEQAQENMDDVAAAMKEVIYNDPTLVTDDRLPRAVDELLIAAKERSEILRSDVDDFTIASNMLRARRNEFNRYEPEQEAGFAASLNKNSPDEGVKLLKEGMELIYDMAHIRGKMPVSKKEYVEKAQEYVAGKEQDGPSTARYS
jgi:hypothetical protein